MHVYASLRMNDQHLEPNPLASTGMTKLRAAHPDWQLGDKTSPFFASSWDMSVRGCAVTPRRYTPRISSSLTVPLAPCPPDCAPPPSTRRRWGMGGDGGRARREVGSKSTFTRID